MKKGLSFRTFGPTIGVSRTTLYDWVSKYPEFKEAKEIAEDSAMLFYEQRLSVKASGQDVNGIDAKKIDLGAICFPLKTRFHQVYGERQKIEQRIEQKNIEIKIDQDDVDL